MLGISIDYNEQFVCYIVNFNVFFFFFLMGPTTSLMPLALSGANDPMYIVCDFFNEIIN